MSASATDSVERVAVTITPVAASRDSRSLKLALAMARAGFRSQLFEGSRSGNSIALAGVEVIGPYKPRSIEGLTLHDEMTSGNTGWINRFRTKATSPRASRISAGLGFLAYLVFYTWHFLIGGLRHIPPASIYYLNEFSYFPAVWIKCRIHGAGLAYDAHDFYSGIEADRSRTPFQRLVVKFGTIIERMCIRSAPVFTTVGSGVAGLYEESFGRRPDVIRNAHDSALEARPAVSLRARTGLSDRDALVVIVGQAKPGQEFSGVLGGLRALPQLHLALIGNGYRTYLEETARRDGLSGRIHYIEGVPATEVVPLIREADAALIVYFPRSENYKNALPNGFFQSVSAGLPLFYGAIPEIDRVCRELNFGVAVPPDDAPGMTKLLQGVIEKSESYKDQRRRSQRAALELTWQREEEKLAALIAQIVTIGEKGRPSK